MWGSTVTIAITTTGKPLPEMPVNYGVTDALAAFPLSRAVNNITININNNSVSMNYADILEPLLRLIDPEELAKYESTTPTDLWITCRIIVMAFNPTHIWLEIELMLQPQVI
jgi:hypothetical protein